MDYEKALYQLRLINTMIWENKQAKLEGCRRVYTLKKINEEINILNSIIVKEVV